MASEPFTILYGPLVLYKGTTGEAAPDLSADPPTATWAQVGASGAKSYTEDGVTVTPGETVELAYVLGSTAPQKARRTQETLEVAVTIWDASAELMAIAFNDADVTDTAATATTAGHRSFDMLKGREISEYALLLRGDQSPYGDGFVAQYWVPRVYSGEIGELAYVKGTPVGVALTIGALEHESDGFGKFYAQDADTI